MLSITSSIIRDFAISPKEENSPVVGPKIKKDMITENKSTNKRTVPILKLVYFFSTIAIISVPPLEAPILNKMADPTAGRNTANTSSSKGSVVRGPVKGTSFSKMDRAADIKILAYTVLIPKLLPKKTNPITRRAMLAIRVN